MTEREQEPPNEAPPPKPVTYEEMRDVFASEAYRIEGSISARRIMNDPTMPVLPEQIRYVEVMEAAIRLIDGIRADLPGFRAWARGSKGKRG